MSSDSSLREALERWAEAIGWMPDADDEEEIVGALLWRDAVADALRTRKPSPAERGELRRLDERFVGLRPALVGEFGDVFRGEERGATPEEWWWWPDQMPADGIARAS